MNDSLIMATLTNEQIVKAKRYNGKGRRMTHVIICGEYGKVFGTEIQCLRLFSILKNTFRKLFSDVKIIESCQLTTYKETKNIEDVLFSKIYEKREKIENKPQPPKSLLSLSRRMKKADLY